MDDVLLGTYYDALSRVEILSKKEELKCFTKWKTSGCVRSRDRVLESCLRLVYSISKNYWKDQNTETLKELISAGNEGLLKALSKFDPEKGVKFSTYSGYWVLMYIRKYAVEETKIVKPPIRYRRQAKLADELDSSDPVRSRQYVTSCEVSENIPSDIDTPEEIYGSAQETASDMFRLGTLTRFLTTRERLIVNSTYGVSRANGESLKNIGEELSLSSERVRQIRETALSKLRYWSELYSPQEGSV